MPAYDYPNARLRAMKSRLLSRRELESLAEAGSLQGFIAALAKTAYRKAVETALARATGMDCITNAMHADLVETIGKIRAFFSEEDRETVTIVLRTYDVHNLKTILRGLARTVPSGEILASVVPVGEFRYEMLVELARAPGPRAAIDAMATLRLPFAQPLLALRARHPGADVFEMELALDQWRFQETQQFLEKTPQAEDTLASAFKLEADLVNILTVLRLVHQPAERKQLRDRLGTDDPTRLFVGPGFLSWEALARAASQDSLKNACEILAGSAYTPALEAGLEKYHSSQRLSDLERQLNRYRLRWLSSQIAKDPLGIGVLLGYLALKTNETGNLHWIARGISLGLKVESLKAEMEFPE